MEILMQYPWPGNVRELSNFVERCCLVHQNKEILPEDLPEKFLNTNKNQTNSKIQSFSEIWAGSQEFVENFNLKDFLQDLEIDLIKKALDQSNGVVSRAAGKLGIKRTTLVEKLKKYSL
ncbi:MAG: helix-turn-helix domain-containing protein [Gammaproteobacteria bacterium]